MMMSLSFVYIYFYPPESFSHWSLKTNQVFQQWLHKYLTSYLPGTIWGLWNIETETDINLIIYCY